MLESVQNPPKNENPEEALLSDFDLRVTHNYTPLKTPQEQFIALFDLLTGPHNDAKLKAFFSALTAMIENNPTEEFNFDTMITSHDGDGPCEYRAFEFAILVGLMEAQESQEKDTIIAKFINNPIVVSYLKEHLHRIFHSDQLMSLWFIIVHCSHPFPNLFKTLIATADITLSHLNAIVPNPHSTSKNDMIRYLDVIAIKNPQILPFLIEKFGRENVNVDYLVNLKHYTSGNTTFPGSDHFRYGPRHHSTKPLDTFIAFIDSTIENNTYFLLKKALLENTEGRQAQNPSFTYLLTWHSDILFVLLAKLGINNLYKIDMADIDLSSAELIQQLMRHLYLSKDKTELDIISTLIHILNEQQLILPRKYGHIAKPLF